MRLLHYGFKLVFLAELIRIDEDMELNWMIICEKVIVDGKTNNPTLMGLFTIVKANNFPARRSPLTIAINLTEVDRSYDLNLHILGPTDESIIEPHLVKVAKEDGPDVNLFLEVEEMILGAEGVYKFRLMDGATVLGEASFKAQKV